MDTDNSMVIVGGQRGVEEIVMENNKIKKQKIENRKKKKRRNWLISSC